MAFQLPKESRFSRKLEPSNEWGWQEVLLNKVAYYLQVLIWQNTEDAHKKNPEHRPEYWLPEFIPQPEKKHNPEEVAMDLDDLKSFLSKPRS